MREFGVHRTLRLSVALLLLFCSIPGHSQAVNAGTLGSWSPVTPWPLIAIHAVLMPDGRVLSYGTTSQGQQTGAFIYDVWDPTAGIDGGHRTLPNTTGTDIFCSAQVVLPYGNQVFIAGGDNWTGTSTTNTANNNTNVFDYSIDTLTRQGDMARPRWYGSAINLLNGDTYIQGGTSGTDHPEIRNSSGNFRLLTGADTSTVKYYFPRNFIAPDGRLFGFDVNGQMYFVNTDGTGDLTLVGTFGAPKGRESTAVMYRPGRILEFGGSSNSARIIDLSTGAPVITSTQSLSTKRMWVNATLLADGTVLATGGSEVANELIGVNYNAEIWNPSTGRWTVGAAEDRARLYHSTALLLPDASVLVAGGGAEGPQTNTNVEIYYPPYLYQASGNLAVRPAIASAPSFIDIGGSFQIEMADGGTVGRVALVKTGSVSHSFNMDQRFVELVFQQQGNLLTVESPTRAADAPPGFYMLFVLDGAGTPSVAPIVKIGVAAPSGQGAAPVLQNPGNQTTPAGQFLSLQLTATDSDSDVLTYGASALPPGLVIDPATGIVSGTPSTAGSFYVMLTASDGSNMDAVNIVWTVSQPPTSKPNTGTGLLGQYFNNKTLSGTPVLERSEAVNFSWSSASPGPGVNTDGFSVRWTGKIEAIVSGNFTFQTTSNDGVRLWINGALVVDNWTNHATITNNSPVITLTKNARYSVTMEYYDNTGAAVARLKWKKPGATTFAAVPATRLYAN